MIYKSCIVNGCDHKHYAKNYCSKHYQQIRTDGYITPTHDRKAIVEDGFAKIPLGKHARQGYAIVDVADKWVDKYRWFSHHGYAVSGTKGLPMHRLLLQPDDVYEVDHINNNRVDNRRSNLRICTKIENSRNSGKHFNNTTGYKGVVRTTRGKPYAAKLGYLGKKLHLGTFDSPEEAAKAYDKKAKELHGQFAALNLKDLQ